MLQFAVSESLGCHELADEIAKDTDSTIRASPSTASVWTTMLDGLEALLQFRGRRAIGATGAIQVIGAIEAIGAVRAVRVALWRAACNTRIQWPRRQRDHS